MDWDELIAQMGKIGVAFKTETIPGPSQQQIQVTYFEHKTGSEVFFCVVDIVDRKHKLLPSMVRRLCRALHIHPKVFGFDLE